MNWKRIGRFLVCLLLVAVLLINCSPIRAEATSAGLAATYAAFAVAPEIAITAAIIALGVAGTAVVLGGVVAECEQFLVENGYISGELVDVYRADLDAKVQYMVSRELVETIRNWLFDSGTLTESVHSVGQLQGEGFTIDTVNGYNWVSSLPLYSLASSANNGGFLLIAGDKTTLSSCTKFPGFIRQYSELYGLDCLRYSSVSNLENYTSASWPCGSFVDGFTDTVGTGCRNDELVFLSYEDAYSVYLQIKNGASYSGSYIYYLTESSFIKVQNNSTSAYIVDVGYIMRSTGAVSTTNFSDALSSTVPYPVVPLGYSPEEIVTVNTELDLDVTGVASSDKSFSEGYSTWALGAKSLPTLRNGEISDAESMYISLGMADTLADTMALTQTEAQTGAATGSNAGTNSGTASDAVTNTGLKGLLESAVDGIVSGLSSALELLFVPSEDFLSEKVSTIRSEFGFIDQFVTGGQMIGDAFNGFDTSPPIIYIDLSATRGDYDIGGKVPFIDLTWYEEYKPTVDMLLSSFLWVVFIWKLFQKAPGIISGMPGDFVMEGLQQLNMDVYLPYRKESHERVRRLNRRSKL